MKKFIFTGVNAENKSGTSWKIWMIERRQKVVTVLWGPGSLHKRMLIPVNKTSRLRRKSWRFRSEAMAREDERRRIQEKLNKGYERVRRRVAR